MTSSEQAETVRERSVRVVRADGSPVAGITVARLASNGTYLQGQTNTEGIWEFKDHFPGTVTVLVGGQHYTAAARTFEASDWVGEKIITVEPLPDGGSLIIPQSTGNIPGLN
jgi:hypothetical protein